MHICIYIIIACYNGFQKGENENNKKFAFI